MWTSDSGRHYWGNELPAPLPMVPLVLGRVCDACKKPTWFAVPRQRTKGRHPLCGADAWTDVLTPEAEREALWVVLDHLPIAYVTKEPCRDDR